MTNEINEVARTLTVSNVLATKVQRITFTGRFYDVFDHPQKKARWFVFGQSSSGKSSFVMQLIKEFAQTEKTLLVSLEEALDDGDLQDRLRMFQMQDVSKKFQLVADNLEELTIRLKRRGSAQVIVIDSAPYLFMGKTFADYLNFTKQFRHKTLVFIGHAKGQLPKTELEERIMYDANQKVLVSGYVATNKGRRFGPHATQFIVWQKGYEDLHGINTKETKDENTSDS